MISEGTEDGFWSGVAAAWEGMADDPHSVYSRRSDWVARMLDRHAPGRRFTDVGCGAGLLCQLMARRGYRVTGVDVSPVMIEAARLRCYRDLTDPFEDLRPCRGDDPMLTGIHDAIALVGVLPYLADPARYLRRLDRHLAPGGVLALSGTNPVSLHTLRALWAAVRRRDDPEVIRGLVRSGAWHGRSDSADLRRLGVAGLRRLRHDFGYLPVERLVLHNLRRPAPGSDGSLPDRPGPAARLTAPIAWGRVLVLRKPDA